MDELLISDPGGLATTVAVGRGLIDTADAFADLAGRRAVVLTQDSVADIAGSIAGSYFDSVGVVVLPDREEAKSIRAVESVYLQLNELGVDRDHLVVGVGGGALTDAAGFIAATYLRGLDAMYVPTTLLGAVDASIGGKTGINVGGKNLAGVFRHPIRVVVDIDLLEALPEHLLREGAAEAVKAGFIADRRIMEAYEKDGLHARLDEVVLRAIKVKADVVSGDFRETGLRAILNYGHTVGHGVEIVKGISHGHAIAIGMTAAAEVSRRLVGFEGAARQRAVLESLGLPVRTPGGDLGAVRRVMDLDKKRTVAGLRMVLLEGFGRPVVRLVDDATVAAALRDVGLE